MVFTSRLLTRENCCCAPVLVNLTSSGPTIGVRSPVLANMTTDCTVASTFAVKGSSTAKSAKQIDDAAMSASTTSKPHDENKHDGDSDF